MVSLSATKVFVYIGVTNYHDMKNTYFLDMDKNTLYAGPQMPNKRIYPSCSKIMGTSTGIYNVIVVGGLDTTMNGYYAQTLILDMKTLVWRDGPKFPYGIFGAPLVEHYMGGVVLVGGKRETGVFTNLLYYLQGEEFDWELLPQKMSSGRRWHVGFLVPDTFVNCTG